MAIKHYLLTIDDAVLTNELLELLASKGAELHEAPIDEFDSKTAKAIDAGLAAIERGERGKPWSQLREKAAQRRASRVSKNP